MGCNFFELKANVTVPVEHSTNTLKNIEALKHLAYPLQPPVSYNPLHTSLFYAVFGRSLSTRKMKILSQDLHLSRIFYFGVSGGIKKFRLSAQEKHLLFVQIPT